jgi:hypothetical protein
MGPCFRRDDGVERRAFINANADFAGVDFAAEPCGREFWLN